MIFEAAEGVGHCRGEAWQGVGPGGAGHRFGDSSRDCRKHRGRANRQAKPRPEGGLDVIAAVVPAAGLSTRMGRPKLLLDVGGQPLIVRVVQALRDGGADPVVVVAPPTDQSGAKELANFASQSGADVVVLEAPTLDMRATIERGIASLIGSPPLGLLIAPADSVGLSGPLVAEVVARFRQSPSRIVVPVRESRRGHPLLLPWSEARLIANLPLQGVGVNAALLAAWSRSLTSLTSTLRVTIPTSIRPRITGVGPGAEGAQSQFLRILSRGPFRPAFRPLDWRGPLRNLSRARSAT